MTVDVDFVDDVDEEEESSNIDALHNTVITIIKIPVKIIVILMALLMMSLSGSNDKDVMYCYCGAWWWLSGKFGALRPEGCRFESNSSHHVGTLGKSFTHGCL